MINIFFVVLLLLLSITIFITAYVLWNFAVGDW